MKYVFIACVFLPLLATAQPSTWTDIQNEFYHHPEHILVAAHRAYHLQFPENSLPAIEAAIRAGIDIVELDVRETKDSVLVLMHDATIDRTTTGKGAVKDFTYQQLQQFTLRQNGAATSQHIPRLEEALQLAQDNIMIDIDFKEDSLRPARNTYRLLEKYHMEKQVLFFVYNYRDVPRFQQLNPVVPIMPRAYSAADLIQARSMQGCPAIHVDESYYSDSLMATAREAGHRVWINALGKYDNMDKQIPGSGYAALLQYRQVNVIQTDYPEKLLLFLRQRQLHK